MRSIMKINILIASVVVLFSGCCKKEVAPVSALESSVKREYWDPKLMTADEMNGAIMMYESIAVSVWRAARPSVLSQNPNFELTTDYGDFLFEKTDSLSDDELVYLVWGRITGVLQIELSEGKELSEVVFFPVNHGLALGRTQIVLVSSGGIFSEK